MCYAGLFVTFKLEPSKEGQIIYYGARAMVGTVVVCVAADVRQSLHNQCLKHPPAKYGVSLVKML